MSGSKLVGLAMVFGFLSMLPLAVQASPNDPPHAAPEVSHSAPAPAPHAAPPPRAPEPHYTAPQASPAGPAALRPPSPSFRNDSSETQMETQVAQAAAQSAEHSGFSTATRPTVVVLGGKLVYSGLAVTVPVAVQNPTPSVQSVQPQVTVQQPHQRRDADTFYSDLYYRSGYYAYAYGDETEPPITTDTNMTDLQTNPQDAPPVPADPPVPQDTRPAMTVTGTVDSIEGQTFHIVGSGTALTLTVTSNTALDVVINVGDRVQVTYRTAPQGLEALRIVKL